MQVAGNKIIFNPKYIYLDWNVIKYMKEPRPAKLELDNNFRDVIFKLKTKYKIPYSIAHIIDRSNNYNESYYEMVKADFDFAETINDTNYLENLNDSFVVIQNPMMETFNEYIAIPPQALPNIDEQEIVSFNVDMDKIDTSHPMYDFLKLNNGIYSAQTMQMFLNDLHSTIFTDASKYKKLREYIKKINTNNDFNQNYSSSEKIMLDKMIYHVFPFLDSFNDNKETLLTKWPEIVERWFSFQGNTLKPELTLIDIYPLLEMHPLFNDKLKNKKNTLDNIIRDGSHCYYASKAKYFVSEDESLRKKTSFLYEAYGIKTKVLSEKEFLDYVNVI